MLWLWLFAVLGSTSAYGYPSYTIYVVRENGTEQEAVWSCPGSGATFGFQLGSDKELKACVDAVSPDDACNADPQPSPPRTNVSADCLSAGFFAVVQRGNCSFAHKALNVEEAVSHGEPAFVGTLVANYEGQELSVMSGEEPYASEVHGPVFMIPHTCALTIRNFYPYQRGYVVYIRITGAENLVRYLIPFVAVLGLAFLILLAVTVVKFVRDRRRRNRRRLSSRNLRKIPTKKYKKGEEPETCPICLDDFDDGEKLRILPCNHAYHCKCVDPWLTKNRKVCPVCKRKVCPSKDDSESETEQPTNSSNPDPTSSADDTQLIPEDPESRPVGNSTFFEAAEPRGFLHRVVPGFLRRDQIARPPPPDPEEDEEDEGIENPGFHQLPDPEEVAVRSAPRRKRHPAHRKNLPRAANTTIRLEESEEESSPGAVDVPRARTHKPPPPEALSRGRRPPVPSTSAPPILPQPSSDEEEGPQESTRVGREDSIQLDMGPIDLQAGPHRLA